MSVALDSRSRHLTPFSNFQQKQFDYFNNFMMTHKCMLSNAVTVRNDFGYTTNNWWQNLKKNCSFKLMWKQGSKHMWPSDILITVHCVWISMSSVCCNPCQPAKENKWWLRTGDVRHSVVQHQHPCSHNYVLLISNLFRFFKKVTQLGNFYLKKA